MFWQGRAITEFHAARRTWFGTITMSPDEHYSLDARIRMRLLEGRTAFDELSPSEQFVERAKEMGSEMSLYIKRLRAGNTPVGLRGPQLPHKPSIRYLLIAEQHDSGSTSVEMRGRPHFHILLHEQHGARTALVAGEPEACLVYGESVEMERRHYKTRNGWLPGVFARDDSFLRQQWVFGHTKFQLATSPNAAVYVCKYLTKAMHVRVRASLHYGVERMTPPTLRREGST